MAMLNQVKRKVKRKSGGELSSAKFIFRRTKKSPFILALGRAKRKQAQRAKDKSY